MYSWHVIERRQRSMASPYQWHQAMNINMAAGSIMAAKAAIVWRREREQRRHLNNIHQRASRSASHHGMAGNQRVSVIINNKRYGNGESIGKR